MTVISLASFKEARAKIQEECVRLWKRSQPRYLGGKDVRCAHYTYECSRCIFYIMPGDEYRRERYARDYKSATGWRTYFSYKRHHLPECYGPTEEEDRRMREEIERQDEAERQSERHAA
jgi:hypothetical protein